MNLLFLSKSGLRRHRNMWCFLRAKKYFREVTMALAAFLVMLICFSAKLSYTGMSKIDCITTTRRDMMKLPQRATSITTPRPKVVHG